MAVVIETTLGDITVDLHLEERPQSCYNFLKLCKIKYYNYNLFHTISRGFIAQTGDPTGSRTGGESIYGVIEGPSKRYVEAERNPRIKHTKMGLISFVCNEDHMMGSQFFFTLGDDLTYLDEKHCVFGEVVEGVDVLEIINEAICCPEERPYQDIRITHTVILDDPFPDPNNLQIPSRSPSPSASRLQNGRIPADEEVDETGKSVEEINEIVADREAKARAAILEMVGDIPDAEMAPPENVLFVCKLNPVTNDDDLEIIFSRFGRIKSCEVIKDKKTGDSLQYAFVEFEDRKSCEEAYFKMDNVLIDDRRIHVDFSQSVSKIKWLGKGRGVKVYNDREESMEKDSNKGKNSEKRAYKRRSRSGSHSRKIRSRSREISRRSTSRSREVEYRSSYKKSQDRYNKGSRSKDLPSHRYRKHSRSPEVKRKRSTSREAEKSHHYKRTSDSTSRRHRRSRSHDKWESSRGSVDDTFKDRINSRNREDSRKYLGSKSKREHRKQTHERNDASSDASDSSYKNKSTSSSKRKKESRRTAYDSSENRSKTKRRYQKNSDSDGERKKTSSNSRNKKSSKNVSSGDESS